MRLYFYCEANYIIYTEREMEKSKLPRSRFQLIGEYKNRNEAEAALTRRHWTGIEVCHSKPW